MLMKREQSETRFNDADLPGKSMSSPATIRGQNDLDELAQEHKGKGGGASKIFAIILLIIFGIGVYSVLDLSLILWPGIKVYLTSLGIVEWITQNAAVILLFAVLVFASALVSGMLIIRVAKNHGVGLVKFSIYAIIVIPWIMVLLAFALISYLGGMSIAAILGNASLLVGSLIVPVLMTIIGIVILVSMREKVERAGMIVSLSGQLLSEEKELILPPIIAVVLTLLTIISAMAFGGSFYLHFILPAADPTIFYAVLGVIEFLFMLTVIVITYSMDGIIIAIAHIWYRKRDPRFKDGRTIVWSRLGRIAKFGVLTAIIKTIIAALRSAASRSRGAGGLVYRATGSIIGSVWYYINYFTLPSVVLEDLSITESIKKSAKRLFNNFGDVLVRQFGVNMAMGALKLLVIGVFAIVGFYFSLLVGLQGWNIIIGVIAFVIMSVIATFPLFRAMRISYLAMLFTYIWDKETGFKKPSRLPEEVKKEIETWYRSELPEIASSEKERSRQFTE